MSDGPDDFTLRLMFNSGVSVDEANDLILQSQQVTADDVWRVRDFGVLAVIDLTADGEVEAPVREAARNVHGDDLVTMCFTSEDFRQGVENFLAKRPMQWQGR